MFSNFQENFHKVNNIMKEQAEKKKIKKTTNQVKKEANVP